MLGYTFGWNFATYLTLIRVTIIIRERISITKIDSSGRVTPFRNKLAQDSHAKHIISINNHFRPRRNRPGDDDDNNGHNSRNHIYYDLYL